MSNGIDIGQRIEALAKRARCSGSLPVEQIALGAHLSWANAVSLLMDARILAARSRFARAFSLTILALEELAKPPRLFAMDSSDDSGKWRSFWKDFTSHSPKQEAIGRYGQLLEAIGSGVYQLKMTEAVVHSLDQLKQWGFYVDCVDGRFRSPDDLGVDLVILDFLFAFAEERADSFGHFHSSVEQSAWCLEHTHPKQVTSSLWPPPIRSDVETQALLMSLASRYSLSQPPDYAAFCDACDQLTTVLGSPVLYNALSTCVRHCTDRISCPALETAAKRSLLMMKLLLMALPEDRRHSTLDNCTK